MGFLFSLLGTAIGGPIGAFVAFFGNAFFGSGQQRPDVRLGQKLEIARFDYGAMFPICHGGTFGEETKGGAPCRGWVADAPEDGGIIVAQEKVFYHEGFIKKHYIVEKAYLTCFIVATDARLAHFIIDSIKLNGRPIWNRNGTPTTTETRPGPFGGDVEVTVPGTQGFTMDAPDADGMEVSTDGILTLLRGSGTQRPLWFLQELHGGVAPAFRYLSGCGLYRFPLERIDNQAPAEIQFFGRDGITGRAAIITKHLGLSDMPAERIHIDTVAGSELGCWQESEESPANLAQQVARMGGDGLAPCDLLCIEDGVYDISRSAPTLLTIAQAELDSHGAGENDGNDVVIGETPDEELPSRFRLEYYDVDKDDTDTAEGVAIAASHNNVQSSQINIVGHKALMSTVAQVACDEAWAMRYSYKHTLPLSRLSSIPGNVGTLPIPEGTVNTRFETQGINGQWMTVAGRSWDGDVYNAQALITTPIVPPVEPPGFGVPAVVIFDSVPYRPEMVGQVTLTLAACATDSEAWHGANISFDDPTIGDYNVAGQSMIAQATTALGPLVSDTFDYTSTITIRPLGTRSPQSATGADRYAREAFVRLTGANRAMLGLNGTGDTRIINFTEATDNLDGTFTLTGLLDDRFGSGYIENSGIGDTFLQIVDHAGVVETALEYVYLTDAQVGNTLTGDYGAATGSTGVARPEFSFNLLGNSIIPISPVHALVARTGGDASLTFDKRTRDYPADSDPDNYTVEIYADDTLGVLLDSRDATALEVDYTAGELSDIFSGSVPVLLSGRIRQNSSRAYGHWREFLNI